MAFDNELKRRVLEKLSASIDDIWLKELNFVEEHEGALKIPLPNFFYIDYYKKNFSSLIEQAVSEISGKAYSITFIAPPEQGRLFPDNLIPRDKASRKQKDQPAVEVKKPFAGSKNDFVLNEHYEKGIFLC